MVVFGILKLYYYVLRKAVGRKAVTYIVNIIGTATSFEDHFTAEVHCTRASAARVVRRNGRTCNAGLVRIHIECNFSSAPPAPSPREF